MRHRLAGAAIVAALAASTPSAATAALATVMQRAREAAGADWTRSHAALHGAGSARFLGQDGRLEVVLAADGRFTRRITAALGDALGFDGARLWTVDWSGMPRELQLAERDWHLMTMAVASGAWLREDFAFEVTLALGATPDAPALDVRHPGSHAPMTLRLDPATHLPARLTRPGILGEHRVEFSAYREVAGARLPMRIEETTAGQEIVFDLRELGPGAAADETAFAVPPAPADARFAADVPAALKLRRARTGHLLVKPRIDGRDVGWFIFDSGAGNSTLSPAAAESLGLPVLGTTGTMSILGLAQAPVRRAATLELGPLTIAAPVFADFDMAPFEPAFGEPVTGVIGYDVMRRAIVELEVAAGRLAIHDPATFDASGLPWRTLFSSDRHPVVEASFESHAGLFKLDVGAAGGPHGNVTMHAPAVRRLGLLEGREIREGHGPAGQVGFGTARSFELAGYRFEDPEVMFAVGTADGPFQDRETLGNIGLRFMEPFRIVFDYAGGRVAFVARGAH